MKANILSNPIKDTGSQNDTNEPLVYECQCGHREPIKGGNEIWQIEAACIMVGCRDCAFIEGDGPVKQDIKRGIAMYVAHEKEAIAQGYRAEEISQIAKVAKTLETLSRIYEGRGSKLK